MEAQGGGLVIALRRDGGFRDPDRARAERVRGRASRSAWRRSARWRSNGCATAWRRASASARAGRGRSTTRASRGSGALRLQLANARDLDDKEALAAAVDTVLEGLGTEIDGLRHLITELRPAALDDLGLAAALEALARRAQAIDGLEVQTEIELDSLPRRPRRRERAGTAWTPSSRARSTASCRRRSRTSAATREATQRGRAA